MAGPLHTPRVDHTFLEHWRVKDKGGMSCKQISFGVPPKGRTIAFCRQIPRHLHDMAWQRPLGGGKIFSSDAQHEHEQQEQHDTTRGGATCVDVVEIIESTISLANNEKGNPV